MRVYVCWQVCVYVCVCGNGVVVQIYVMRRGCACVLLTVSLLSFVLVVLRPGRVWVGCSLKGNNIGDEGASAIAEALKTNSALEELKYVHGVCVWCVAVVLDVGLVWCCGGGRGWAQ